MSHPGVAANGGIPPLFDSWTFDLWVEVPLGLAVVVYVHGWRRLHRRVPQRFGAGRLAAFVGGMVAIGAALESPLHALGAQWLPAQLERHACERGNRLNNADARGNRAGSIEVRKKLAEPWNAS